ncbi:MAG: helix-turn-helix domain-containing protein [Clostridia bacterium]|nr:helix-turn-helix domain-containing protein [Clostridia bacterium]
MPTTEEKEKTLKFKDKTLKHGFTSVPNAVLEEPDLSPGAKITYFLLLKFAWKSGEAFPGQEKLADAIGCSEKTVRTYLSELQEAGLISCKRRGLTQTNVYYINDLRTFLDRKPSSGQERKPASYKEDSDQEYKDQESYSIDSNPIGLESIHAPSTGACVSETPEEVIRSKSSGKSDGISTERSIKRKAPEEVITYLGEDRTSDEVVKVPMKGGDKRKTPEDESPDADVEESCNNYTPSGVLNASVSNKDLIAILGNGLRRVIEPKKAYAIAGRLYNLYDFPAAEFSVSALVRRFEKGDAVENPIAYLFKVARIKKEELESGQKYDRFLEEEYRPFSEKYPEGQARRGNYC